jgi:hypothetical protein
MIEKAFNENIMFPVQYENQRIYSQNSVADFFDRKGVFSVLPSSEISPTVLVVNSDRSLKDTLNRKIKTLMGL